jgi:hypothetical protein
MLGSAVGLMALGALLGLVAFVGSIWLVVVAFRKGGMLWGFLTLFVPFANIVFAVKFWPDAKKPFLTSFVPGVACGFCFFLAGGMAASAVGGEMARQMQEEMQKEQARMNREARTPRSEPVEMPSEEQPAASIRVVDDASSAAYVLNTLPPPALPKSEFDPETVTRDGYAPVPFADAKNYVGRAAKIVMKNGRTHRGTITAARPGAVELEQYLGAGSISVEFAARETETLLVDAR